MLRALNEKTLKYLNMSFFIGFLLLFFGIWSKMSLADVFPLKFEANNKDHKFQLINNDDPNLSIRVKDISAKTGALLVVNGGFYNPDFSPTGYLKINHKVISSVNSKGFSGYIAISQKGELDIFFKKLPDKSYPTIFQSGPFLVDPGGQHGIRTPDERKANRSAIIRHKSGKYTFILVKNITLYELANKILNVFDDVDFALNLDGGPVAGFWDKNNLSQRHLNLSPSRNYLVIYPR